MQKVEQIQDAIERGLKHESGMTDLAWSVPALASLKGRHILNNLGAISERYLECGNHKGGTFVSVLCNNKLISATGIDSFASDEPYHNDQAEPQFLENVKLLLQLETNFYFHKCDVFNADLSSVEKNIDFYFYDASHGRADQKNALIYYKPILAEEFIYVCDDWEFGEVKMGTLEGINEGGYDILFERELLNPSKTEEHQNNWMWRGYAVYLLRKK